MLLTTCLFFLFKLFLFQEALGPKGSCLSVETFARALTSDVVSYKTQAGPPDAQTSVFFDVFGRNWDEGAGDLGVSGGATLVKTASYIDYAADSYRSILHNTSVWCLFILTSKLLCTLSHSSTL